MAFLLAMINQAYDQQDEVNINNVDKSRDRGF